MGKQKIVAKQHPEDIVQQQVVAYLTAVARPLKIAFHSVPNEAAMKGRDGKAKYALILWLKKMALIKGAADLVIYYDHGHAAVLECKSPTGRQSECQIDFETWIRRPGVEVPYYLIRSIKELETVLRLLGITK